MTAIATMRCMKVLARSVYSARSVRCLGNSSGSAKDSPLRQLVEGAATYGERVAPSGELHWATEPYTAVPGEPTEKEWPENSTVLLFPGQGSQFVGMGRRVMHLPQVRELYQLASETLKWDVARVCTEGPEEELARRCQPCVLVTSLAAVEAAREARPGALAAVRAVSGFSLGELTALVYARALPLEGALRLVEVRAAAMAAAAAERPPGGLLTVWLAPAHRLPAALQAARDAAAAAGVLDPIADIANYLYANCKVIAGDEEALRFLEREGGAFGVRRSARVAVGGALHSRAMQPAERVLRAALSELSLAAPATRVMSALDVRPYRDPAQIARKLSRAVAAPVRWEQTLHALFARPARLPQTFPLTLALGPGRVLRATLKQVNAKAWDNSLQVDV